MTITVQTTRVKQHKPRDINTKDTINNDDVLAYQTHADCLPLEATTRILLWHADDRVCIWRWSADYYLRWQWVSTLTSSYWPQDNDTLRHPVLLQYIIDHCILDTIWLTVSRHCQRKVEMRGECFPACHVLRAVLVETIRTEVVFTDSLQASESFTIFYVIQNIKKWIWHDTWRKFYWNSCLYVNGND